MTDEISLTLAWFANYTNFYSVLCVVLCFCVMVVFILRLNGEHFMGSSATHYNVVREQKMMSLSNPFSIQLSSQATSSLSKGLNVVLSSTTEARWEVFWGVNIQLFQQEIQLPSADIDQRFHDGNMFDRKYIQRDQQDLLTPDSGISYVSLQCPEGLTEEHLGEPPRSEYPLVVVMVMNDIPSSQDYSTIVIQLTVIHLKDSLCSLDSHIVYQFVKTNEDKLISLQPIYLSAPNQVGHSSPSIQSPNSSRNNSSSSNVSQTSNKSTGTTLKSDSSLPTNLSASRSNRSSPSNTTSVVTNSCSPKSTVNKPGVSSSLNSIESEEFLNHVEDLPNGDVSENGMNNSYAKKTQSGFDNSEKRENGKKHENSENADVNIIRSDSDDSENSVNTDVIEGNSDSDCDIDPESACCVCQTAHIFYTLLPCRHACVCSSCIQQLDRCPMCRSFIDSYFRLDPASVPESVMWEDSGSNPQPANRWQAFNQRLNEMLGLA